jgi:NAD(P)-dependent dehydrogenase (short-subunit alcohol dehydrogenase family)
MTSAEPSSGLNGRVAIVTGAARGIGRATAVRLAAEGADIVACDIAGGEHDLRTTDFYGLAAGPDLQETARLVGESGRRCLTFSVDIRSSERLRTVAERTVAELGRLDILAACAGISSFARLDEMDDSTWDQMIAVNLTGTANSIRAVIPHMIRERYGRIAVVGSTAGRRGAPMVAHYSAAKWGVHGLVKCASLELHPQGITINIVNPGPVNTAISNNPGVDEYARKLGQVGASTGGDLLPPEAIAHAIAFLATEEAKHISGAAIDVADGRNALYTA